MVAESESPLLAHKGHGDEDVLAVLERRTFFWQGGSHKRKYHLVRWEIINKSTKYGGLGIKNIQLMNISLLCKWWWKLKTGTGLWQEIVKM